jgi:hypothetical protein
MVHGAHLFVLSIDVQVSLDPAAATAVTAVARNGALFSQCNVVWGGFPWARCSRCQKFVPCHEV